MSRLVRIAEKVRARVPFEIDGQPFFALEGDTLLVALLCNARAVRDSEFGDGSRAGFCMMAACQDCWVWTAEGEHIRACSTPVAAGMRIVTHNQWPALRAM